MNVDYNGDGIFEDLVVDNFTTGGFSLADDGTLVVTVTFDELDGTRVGNALTTLDISNLVGPPACVLADVNMNGIVDFNDIPDFVTVLLMGPFQCEADCDENNVVDFNDIPFFVNILLGLS